MDGGIVVSQPSSDDIWGQGSGKQSGTMGMVKTLDGNIKRNGGDWVDGLGYSDEVGKRRNLAVFGHSDGHVEAKRVRVDCEDMVRVGGGDRVGVKDTNGSRKRRFGDSHWGERRISCDDSLWSGYSKNMGLMEDTKRRRGCEMGTLEGSDGPENRMGPLAIVRSQATELRSMRQIMTKNDKKIAHMKLSFDQYKQATMIHIAHSYNTWSRLVALQRIVDNFIKDKNIRPSAITSMANDGWKNMFFNQNNENRENNENRQNNENNQTCLGASHDFSRGFSQSHDGNDNYDSGNKDIMTEPINPRDLAIELRLCPSSVRYPDLAKLYLNLPDPRRPLAFIAPNRDFHHPPPPDVY